MVDSYDPKVNAITVIVYGLPIGPCLFGGNCTNTPGFFMCSCPPGRRGHRCQYDTVCNNASRCADGETCVETLASIDGFVCDMTPSNSTLTIQLSEGLTPEILDEQMYNLVSLRDCICNKTLPYLDRSAHCNK